MVEGYLGSRSKTRFRALASEDGAASHEMRISSGARRYKVHAAFVLLFWSSLGGIVYTYLGYPLLVWLVAHCCEFPGRRRGRAQPSIGGASEEDLPEITVLIVAHNAEHHIRGRIRNILESDYPQDRLNVLVASDASTDATVATVEQLGGANIRAIDFAKRRGKVATLADAMGYITNDVVVFTDASNRFDPQALHHLASHFRDPAVGLVTGKVTMVDEQGRPSESLYWRSEMMLRRCEAKLGVLLGASGAIYAIRRKMFVKPARPVINDDLVLPILVHLTHGCRAVFDDAARAYVTSVGGIHREFRRRCRIGAGALQCLPVLSDLLRWRNKSSAFAFASHKLLRWLCPFFLLVLLVSDLALASTAGYGAFLAIQVAAYLTAACGAFLPNRGVFARVARPAASFVFMNLALLVGITRSLFVRRSVIWAPTQRPVWTQLEADQAIWSPGSVSLPAE